MCIQSGEWVIILRIKGLGKRIKSMRFYLFLLIFLAGIIPAFIIKETTIRSIEGKLVSQKTMELRQRCSLLANQLGAEASLQMVLANSEGLQNELNWISEMYSGHSLQLTIRIVLSWIHMGWMKERHVFRMKCFGDLKENPTPTMTEIKISSNSQWQLPMEMIKIL